MKMENTTTVVSWLTPLQFAPSWFIWWYHGESIRTVGKWHALGTFVFKFRLHPCFELISLICQQCLKPSHLFLRKVRVFHKTTLGTSPPSPSYLMVTHNTHTPQIMQLSIYLYHICIIADPLTSQITQMCCLMTLKNNESSGINQND